MMNLLLVEDDNEISQMLCAYLETEGFMVTQAADGDQACVEFQKQTFSLVLLDLMIPKKSGMEVMRWIRKRSTVPIIIVSAKDTDSDKTLGLGFGADDYITKPFSVTEVLARIKANIRRTALYDKEESFESEIRSVGNLRMNFADYTVMKSGKKIELTAKEFSILKLLVQNPSRVYTKAQLYAQVWKEEYMGDENAVNAHISRLRNKIEDNPREPKIIVTVWGIGYKLGDFV